MTTTRERLLNEHPEWREHQERLKQARNALAKVQEQSAEETAARAEMEREHRAAVIAAAEDGSPVPDDLPPPSEGIATALQYASHRVMNLQPETQSIKADIAEKVEVRAREEHDKIVADVKELVDRLADAAGDLSSLLKLVIECRSAVEAQGPRRSQAPSTRTRPKVTAAELVEDVQRGACVLDPEPMRGPQPSQIVVDRGPDPHEGHRHPPGRIPMQGRQV